jgi:hypothetical protein
MGFLLEGKKFEDAAAVPAQSVQEQIPATIQVQPEPPRYIGETEDYGLKLIGIQNPSVPDGVQYSYFVVHKRHQVIGFQSNVLGEAIQALSSIQRVLDEALNKDKVKN